MTLNPVVECKEAPTPTQGPRLLDRLRAANAKLYRTDLQGEITITTKGKENDYAIKVAKETKSDLWLGRPGQKDDSTRSGFIAYGDFGAPPKTKAGK